MEITKETRRESYGAAKQDAAARRRVILEILTERGQLTELKAAGQVEVTGKTICDRTGRSVAVWAVKKEVSK